MKSQPANNQEWLIKKMIKKGGTISFYDYMDFVLYDINNGYYGSGRANLGSKGDFVTSPSMSDDFAFLLSKQIYNWLIQLKSKSICDDKLSVIEFGAGDGSLMIGLLEYFLINDNEILKNVCFIIIEPNKGMMNKQKKKLEKYLKLGFDILWKTLEDLEDKSLNGVLLANEVLDANKTPFKLLSSKSSKVFHKRSKPNFKYFSNFFFCLFIIPLFGSIIIKQTFFNISLSLIRKYSRRPIIRLPSPAPNSITDNLSSQIDLLLSCINQL
jgi:SAM-dependent MidA family methyltransferase